MIIQLSLDILTNQRVGGEAIKTADFLIDIIAKAKTAVELETGQPLDVNKIKPYIPID
jgi:hypothetical protein